MNPTCQILKLRFKLDSANVPLRQYGRGSVKCNLNTAPHCLIRGQWLLLSLRSTPLYDTILSTRSMNILQGVRAWYTYFSLQYESSVEVVGVDRCLRRRRSIVLFTRFTSDFFLQSLQSTTKVRHPIIVFGVYWCFVDGLRHTEKSYFRIFCNCSLQLCEKQNQSHCILIFITVDY